MLTLALLGDVMLGRGVDAAWDGRTDVCAGKNAEEAAQPAFLEVPGTSQQRLALLAFTGNEPVFAVAAQRPGVNYLPVSLTDEVIGHAAAHRTFSGGAGICQSAARNGAGK